MGVSQSAPGAPHSRKKQQVDLLENKLASVMKVCCQLKYL